MIIKGLQKHTLIDYPGKIACTIFVFGCNFKCGYCHNPELVDAKLAKDLKAYSDEEIFEFLGKNKDFLEGVCITGGEPTLYPELPQFIEKIKQLGYQIKLDTNGTNPEMLQELLNKKLVDYVAMDIKAPLKKEPYERVVNVEVDIDKILKSIDIIKKFPDYEFRNTVVPEWTNVHILMDIAEYLKQVGANKAFYLQNFRKDKCLDPECSSIEPYSRSEMQEFCEAIKPYFEKCEMRGETY